MFRKTILFLTTVLVLSAQSGSSSGPAAITIFPPPNQAFEEVKQHLGLSDAQIDQLRKLLEEVYAARQEIYRQIQEKQTELNNLLQSGSRDVSRIGQLTIDIHTLSSQPPPSNDGWRQRALAILTAEQRTKLGPLDQAMKLSTPAYQAVTLNLIDPPPPGRPIILNTGLPGIGAVPCELPVAPSPGTPVPLPAPISR